MFKEFTSKASFGCPKWKCIIPKHNEAISYLPTLLPPAAGTKSNPSFPALLFNKQTSSVQKGYTLIIVIII
jgi:hypothetical protein